MHVDMRIAQSDWTLLKRHFASSFQSPMASETGALALLGQCSTSGRRDFIVAKVLLPEGGNDLKESSCGSLVFGASFLRRAHLEMRKKPTPILEQIRGLVPYSFQQ